MITFYNPEELSNEDLYIAYQGAQEEYQRLLAFRELLDGLATDCDTLSRYFENHDKLPVWVRHAYSLSLSLVGVLERVQTSIDTCAEYGYSLKACMPRSYQLTLDSAMEEPYEGSELP